MPKANEDPGEDLPAQLKPSDPLPPSAVVEDTLAEGRPAPPPAAPAVADAPIGSTAALVQALRSIRLLRGNQQDELDTLQQSFPDPRGLARELMQRNWLTPYQINQVFQGRQGSLVLGPYVLVERVGEGGMGTVYKARHQLMDRVVALKVIRKSHLGNDDAVRRFHREIRAAAQLQHPHIVMAYDADHVGDVHFLVMEFVEGTDLGKVLRKQGPLPIDKACDYIRQAFLGLEHAHEKGMVHRDLKPGNLLLSSGGVVKILDMGLARISQGVGDQTLGGELTQEGSVMGTPDYIAPEQAQESHTVDIRADIYSLGCALYHLLAGQVPFPGGTLAQKLVKHMSQQPAPVELVRPGLPAGLGDVVRCLMAKKPAERYQTPAQAAAALEPFCRVLPPGAVLHPAGVSADASTLTFLPAPPPTPVSLRTLWTNRRVRRILLGVAGALVLLVAALWMLRPTPPERRHPLDGLTWEKIPAGDRFAWQPAGLVAVLGEHRVRNIGGNTLLRVAVSADSKLGAAAGEDGLVHLFDPETLREQTTLSGHGGAIYAVAFSPDGKHLATGGSDATVVLWDVKARKLLKRWEGHTGRVRGVAFSPDGKRVLSGGDDQTVRLWEAGDARPVRVFKGHTTPVFCVAFAPDGSRIFSGSGGTDPKGEPADCGIRVWGVKDGKEVRRLHKGLKQAVMDLAVSKDGRRLLYGGNDGLRWWEVEGGEESKVLTTIPSPTVALSPDGRLALTGSPQGGSSMYLWDVATGRNLRSFAGLTSSVAFLPDGRRALIAAGDTLRCWDTEDNRELHPVFGNTQPVSALAFSQDGRYLVSGSNDYSVRLWDLAEVRELHVLKGHRQAVSGVALSPEGQYILSCSPGNIGGGDKTRLWDAGSGRELRQLERTPGGVTAVAFAPEELQALAPALPLKGKKDSEYGFALWDVEDGKQLRRFDGNTNEVFQLGYFPDGLRAFSASIDGTVRLWEVETGKQLEKFDLLATRVAFNEDGSRAYTGHGDGTVQRWNLSETPPKPFAFERWHEGGVNALALASDGTLLVSAAGDGRVIVWDLAKSQKVGVWPPFSEKARVWPQPSQITALALAPDGRHLAVATNNCTIYIIRLDARGKGLELRRGP